MAALAIATASALGGCVSLTSTQGRTSAERLSAYHWQLQQVLDASGTAQPAGVGLARDGRAAAPLQLDFGADGAISVRHLCNPAGGRYTLQGMQVRIGPLAHTRKACADTAVMALEERVYRQLPQAVQWRLHARRHPPTLQLRFADGSRWTLQGTPTYASRYGPPEQVFWEIAPNPCTPAPCLQVRTVRYDVRGLKTELDAWEHFYGSIEGYTHHDGMRALLRLQRYVRRSDTPGATPATSHDLYVLDLVVESERMR